MSLQSMVVGPGSSEALDRCLAAGGVALFPADTVYGLGVDPESEAAVDRLYALKGRPPARPSAVLWFDLDRALAALPDLGPRTRAAVGRLLPGPVTLVLANPAGLFPLACGPEPGRLGVRVPAVDGLLAGLADMARPLLQSSANPSGAADARRLGDVDDAIRSGVDLELDGGALPGTPSTVIDLEGFEALDEFRILREGALGADLVESLLTSVP